MLSLHVLRAELKLFLECEAQAKNSLFSAAKRATEPATGTGNGKRRTLRKFPLRIEWETLAWSLGPIINGPVKLLLFTWKMEVLIVWFSYMIKLPVNETKWSILLARTRALILFIWISIFDFGPKKVIGTFKKRAPGPHYCARPMRFGSRGNALTEKAWEVKNDEVFGLWESTK